MKNVFKPFFTAVIAFLLFAGFNSVQAQTIFHVETAMPGCGLQAKVGYGPSGGCAVTVWTTENVMDGDNFYAIPPGLEVKVFYVQNPGATTNTGYIVQGTCGTSDNDVSDCSGGSYLVTNFQGPYSIFDEYVMIY